MVALHADGNRNLKYLNSLGAVIPTLTPIYTMVANDTESGNTQYMPWLHWMQTEAVILKAIDAVIPTLAQIYTMHAKNRNSRKVNPDISADKSNRSFRSIAVVGYFERCWEQLNVLPKH